MTSEQAYVECKETFRSWVNWNKPTDFVGLMLGLGDLYIEIRMLERELGITDAFDPIGAINWK